MNVDKIADMLLSIGALLFVILMSVLAVHVIAAIIHPYESRVPVYCASLGGIHIGGNKCDVMGDVIIIRDL